MILVIGGASSGKLDYVRSLGWEDNEISDGVLDGRPVLYNLQALVQKGPSDVARLLPDLLKKEVVICNEVGSGVIPVVRAERQGREQTGRLCIMLAKQAERVVRLVCGIPTVIKG